MRTTPRSTRGTSRSARRTRSRSSRSGSRGQGEFAHHEAMSVRESLRAEAPPYHRVVCTTDAGYAARQGWLIRWSRAARERGGSRAPLRRRARTTIRTRCPAPTARTRSSRARGLRAARPRPARRRSRPRLLPPARWFAEVEVQRTERETETEVLQRRSEEHEPVRRGERA